MSRQPPRPTMQRTPICPERVRAIGSDSFAFVPHRFLRQGFFATLTMDERGLYFFLLLAADRNGVSFYRYDTICAVLQLPLESYLAARNALIDKDLIAFDGTRFQVLALPEHPRPAAGGPLRTPADLEAHDPTTIRDLIQRSFPPHS